ncbi:MAG: hypothetical protein ABSD85_06045 [Acidimicrobiales bacterium]
MRTEQARWRGAAVVVTVVALASAVPAAASTSATRTKVVTVYPWTSGGKLKAGLLVAGTVKGTCWTSSIAVSASDAYRCMAKSFIYDPCFAPQSKTFTQLACMVAPWGQVTRFDLTAPIAKAAEHPNGKPWIWADQLGNGIRCITATGTGVEIDKVALNYYCDPGTGWASIPGQKTEPWTTRYAKSYKAKTLQTESVTTAWY